MAKLTVGAKRTALVAALKKLFTAKVASIQAEHQKLAIQLLNFTFKEELDYIASLPKNRVTMMLPRGLKMNINVLDKQDGCCYGVPRITSWYQNEHIFSVDSGVYLPDILVPLKIATHAWEIEEQHPMLEEFTGLVKSIESLNDEIKKRDEQIWSVLSACSTDKQVADMLPEIAKLLPRSNTSGSYLPVPKEMIDEINKLLESSTSK